MCAGLMLFGPVHSQLFQAFISSVLYLLAETPFFFLFFLSLISNFKKNRAVPHFNWKGCIFFAPLGLLVVASEQEVLSQLGHNQQA